MWIFPLTFDKTQLRQILLWLGKDQKMKISTKIAEKTPSPGLWNKALELRESYYKAHKNDKQKKNYPELKKLYSKFDVSDDAEICLAVGGDGTFIKAANEFDGPILDFLIVNFYFSPQFFYLVIF